ncbi:MAG: YfhO family protein [Raoultibacter sp.]
MSMIHTWLCTNKRYEYFLVPLATLALLLIAMAYVGIFPFGDKALLNNDGTIQYVGLFSWFSEALHGNVDLGYSFAKGLGGGTFGLFTYYLASPLNLLAYFYSPENMAELFSVLIPLKLCLASLTCYAFLRSRFDAKGIIYATIAVAYALAASSFGSLSNVMWLDALILLPLMCLGIFFLVSKQKTWLLFVCVAGAILSNWYAAYMLCVFSLFYITAELIIARLTKKQNFKTILSFGATMLFALGTSMIFFLPAIIDLLAGGNATGEGYPATVITITSFSRFLAGFYVGNVSMVGELWATNIPLASLLILGAFLYFINKKSGGQRLIWLIVLLFLIASFLIKPLDMIWTGLIRADSYNPRYYFIFVFVMAICATQGIANLKKITAQQQNKALVTCAIFYLILLLAPLALNITEFKEIVSLRIFAGQIIGAFLLLALGKLFLLKNNKSFARPAQSLILILFVGVFCVEQCYIVQSHIKNYDPPFSVSAYKDYMTALSASIEQTPEEAADQFYRSDNAYVTSTSAAAGYPFSPTTTEHMALGIPCLSHYSSTANASINTLLGSLGYSKTPNTRGIVYYNAPLIATDSIFGVKYVYATHDIPLCQKKQTLQLPAPYEDRVSLYENPSAFSLGFTVDASAHAIPWTDDAFANQEQWIASMTGKNEESLYRTVEAVPTSAMSIDSPDMKKGSYLLSWEITAPTGGPLYAYVNSPRTVSSLFVNDIFLQTVGSWNFDTNVACLGTFAAGETAHLNIYSDAPLLADSFTISSSIMDETVFRVAINQLQDNQLALSTFEEGHIEGSFDIAEGRKLLLTIPHEKGWTILVDGQKAQAENLNGLICLTTSAGNHKISMTYTTPGLLQGISVSALSLAGFALWRSIVLYRKQHRSSTFRHLKIFSA